MTKLDFKTGFTVVKIRRVRKYPHYQVVSMIVDDRAYGGDGALPMVAAFTHNWKFLGSPRQAKHFVTRCFITHFEQRRGSSICTIGYSPFRRKWFGWSHRAIAGFGLGSVVKKGDVICTDQMGFMRATRRRLFKVGYRPKTMADAKRMAKLFASEVS